MKADVTVGWMAVSSAARKAGPTASLWADLKAVS